MRLEIPAYNHIKHSQEINLKSSKICTIIGGNGAGKSTLLESIFSNGVDESSLIVAFSSGQNERYSEIYEKLKKKTFKTIQLIGNDFADITKYYFNSEWVPLLIFTATSLKNGRVRQYLESNKYILVESNIDKSSLLEFDFAIPGYYIETYQKALKSEEHDSEYKSVRNTYIHKYIEKIAEKYIKSNYDFDDPIKATKITLKSEDVVPLFERNASNIFTFISLANYSSKNPILDYKNAKLSFEKNLSFSQLSDGEYQLLSIYAIIDLFDGENTIFLLDEVDSHLHYENLQKLWKCLSNISGKILTTTHLIDSILQNDIESIKLVYKNEIQKSSFQAVLDHLNVITANKTYGFKIAASLKNIVLVENYTDWFIFNELCKVKIIDYDENLFSNIHYINCSAGYDSHSEIFGNNKLFWFCSYKDQIPVDENKIKNIFMLCDRDTLPLASINNKTNVTVALTEKHEELLRNKLSIKSHLLSWKRKQIENYLISKTMNSEYGLFSSILDKLPRSFDWIENSPMDCNDIRDMEIKIQMQQLYCENGVGVNYDRLRDVIGKIPPEEISEDIVLMYNFIKNKVERV